MSGVGKIEKSTEWWVATQTSASFSGIPRGWLGHEHSHTSSLVGSHSFKSFGWLTYLTLQAVIQSCIHGISYIKTLNVCWTKYCLVISYDLLVCHVSKTAERLKIIPSPSFLQYCHFFVLDAPHSFFCLFVFFLFVFVFCFYHITLKEALWTDLSLDLFYSPAVDDACSNFCTETILALTKWSLIKRNLPCEINV